MESRIRVLFLIVAIVSLSGCAATKNLFGFGSEEAPPPVAEPPGQVIDPQVERREIDKALAVAQNNKTRAADLLGISRFTLQRKLEKYGMN